MFGDWQWDDSRATAEEARLWKWLEEVGLASMVIVECGAGTGVPTVRRFCEELTHSHRATMIRINLREPQAPPGHVGLAMSSLEALRALDSLMTP
jgi:hypothetical protein